MVVRRARVRRADLDGVVEDVSNERAVMLAPTIGCNGSVPRLSSWFVADGEHGLEVRSLGFFVDHGSLHTREAGFGEHGFKFNFAEAEPFVGVQLARFFKAMLCEVKDCNTPSGMKDAPCFQHGTLGMQGV